REFFEDWCAKHSHLRAVGRGDARRAISLTDVMKWLRIAQYVATQNGDIEEQIDGGQTAFDWPSVANDGLTTAAANGMDWAELVAKSDKGKPKTRRDIRAEAGVKTGDTGMAVRAIV